jgi:hypothetical protein
LDHSHRVAVFVKVLGDIVARVAAADNYGFLALPFGGNSACELGRMNESRSFEGVYAFDMGREIGLSTMTSGLNDMLRKLDYSLSAGF